MRRPFYLGVRSLTLFESALRDVNRDVLRSLLAEASAGKPDALEPHKIRLVAAELARREAADLASFIATIPSLLGFAGVLLI